MRPLHRTLLAAPLFLSLACNVNVGGSAADSTTTEDPSTSSDPQTSNPPTTNETTDTTPTTTNETTSSGTSSGETDPTTSGGTTGGTTTTEGTTTDGTTGGGGTVCMATSECDDGQFCWAPFTGENPTEDEFVCQPACIDDMGPGGNSEDAWCIDDASCCTAGSTCGDTGYCVPEAGMTDTGETEGSTGTGESTAGDTGESTAGDTGTTGGLMEPLILLTGFEVFGDCMPMVPEDPISAKWTASFDNKLGLADYTATVSSATLTYSPGVNEFVQDITVAPTTSGIVGVGKTVMKAQSKTKALMNLPMDCSQCGKQVDLEILFDVGGEPVIATASAVMLCGL